MSENIEINPSTEDEVFTAARETVDSIVATTALLIQLEGVQSTESFLMEHFVKIIEVEDLLVSTSFVYPHRESECRDMFIEMVMCEEATEILLSKLSVVPYVINL